MKTTIATLLLALTIALLASYILPLPPWPESESAHEATTDLSQLDVYQDIVQPILERRCGTCHNPDKRSGSLDISSHAGLRRGGDSGPAISAGNARISLLIDRVTLPRDDEAFMPAEGRTPLNAAQIEILSWWIEAGAPEQAMVSSLDMDDTIAASLVQLLDGDDDTALAMTPPATAVEPGLALALYDAGFLFRPIARGESGLIIATHAPGQAFSSQQLGLLSSIAPYIVELDLRTAALEHHHLMSLPDMPSLTTLNLANNRLGNDAASSLIRFQALQHLNLSGNPKINNASLEILLALPTLQRLYLWGTSIDPDALAMAASGNSALVVDTGAAGFASGLAD